MCDCHCLSTIMLKYSLISYSFFAKHVDSVAVSDRKAVSFPFVDGCFSVTGERHALPLQAIAWFKGVPIKH